MRIHYRRIRSRLALILLLSLAGLGWHPRAAAGGAGPPPGWTALAPERLGELRGGYVLHGGLVVSFGFERLAWVNGELVASLRVDVPDVARISADQARELARLQELQRIQIGPGNRLDEVAGAGAGLVLQNTLDDAHIRVRTTISAGTDALGLLQAMNFNDALGQAGRGAAGGGP